MLKYRGFALSFALAALVAAPSAHASTLLNAGVTKACGADTCFTNGKSYKQTFSSADFKGAVNISSLALQRGILGALEANVVKVSFQLADGTELGKWGSFMIAVLNGDVVTLGGDAFTWDTSMGDLVLKLDLVLPEKGGGGGFGGGGGGFAGAFGLDRINTLPTDAPPPDDALNIVRELVGPTAEATISAVPEPTSWALMLLGVGGMGAILRHRRALSPRFG